MALKVVGATHRHLRVTEYAQSPMAAREIAMECETCGKRCYGVIPFNPTPAQRQAVMRAAMEEHRLLCKVGSPDDRRVYRLLYPRA